MNKQTVLYASIASLVLVVLGEVVNNSSATVGLIALGLGSIAGLVAWIGGLIRTAQLSRWGWFVAVLLLGTLGSLIYGIAGPNAKRA